MIRTTSNHHRYGEVKTRLTIGTRSDFKAFPPLVIFLEKRAKAIGDRRVTILQAATRRSGNPTAAQTSEGKFLEVAVPVATAPAAAQN
jgi:hypothetical protein